MNRYQAIAVFLLTFVTAGLAAAAEAPAETPRNKRVWLSDIKERAAEVGYGAFGKHGWQGFDPDYITVNGLKSPHGLGVHPKCQVEYVLEKRYRTFRGTAAMDDSSNPPSEWPVEFRVLGDGKLLWKSRGMHGKGDAQPCLLDITGVDVLRLEVDHRPGGSGGKGHSNAVWVEPYVAADPPRPDVLALFDPKFYDFIDTEDNFEREVADLLEKEDFDGLEAIVEKYRKKDVFWSSDSALRVCYSKLEHPEGNSKAAWEKHFARLERWQKAQPKSFTPLVALGQSYIDYAWVARGHGYADTVTPEGAKAMNERNAKARDYLDKALEMKPADAEVYLAMMQLELTAGDSKDDLLRYFDLGRKIEPRYFGLYDSLTNYLLPKWHGMPGEIQEQAARLRKEIGGELGDEIYLRMARYEYQEGDVGEEFFQESEFKYEDLLPGMKIALRDYPQDNGCYNVCCLFACLAEDKDMAVRLMPRLDSAKVSTRVWKGNGRLEYFRGKFDPPSHAGDVAKTLAGHLGIVTSVTYFKDASILAGGEWSGFELWDAGEDEPISTRDTERQIGRMAVDAADRMAVVSQGQGPYASPTAVVYDLRSKADPIHLEGHTAGVMSVAITADGKRCGTAAGDKTARIWDLADPSKPIVLKHPEALYDIAFSPDGKTVATAGNKGGLWLWDAATGKAVGEPLVPAGKGPWYCRVRFLPKSNRLVTASADGTVRRWDLATRQFVQVRPMNSGAIEGLAVSPDEKWIAVGRSEGRVDLLSMETLKTLVRHWEHIGPVESLAFAADSRTLASGSFDCTIKVWPVPESTAEPPPAVVKQAADGTIRLAAGSAHIVGAMLQLEPNEPENLGYWRDVKDYATWDVVVEKAGDYVPELTYSLNNGGGMNEVELSAGKEAISVTLPQTKGWKDYQPRKMPHLHLPQGKITLTLKATHKEGQSVMNLQVIVLRPAQ